MSLKFDPRMFTYPHGYEELKDKNGILITRKGKPQVIKSGYKMPHLAKITLEKIADLPEDRIRVQVVGNEAYASACGTCSVRFKKNELVGAEYVFDLDCFL